MTDTAHRSVKAHTAPAGLRSELAALLRADGCPVCSCLAEAERSFFSWFVNENHAAAAVQAQLRASMGMCPAHSRRLMEDPGPGPVLSTVAREGVAGARGRLRGETAAGPCPVCAALTRSTSHVAHVIAGELGREDNARRYMEHRGVCLDHLGTLVDVAAPEVLAVVAERLLSCLRESNRAELLTQLASTDCDAARRARWRAALPEGGQAESTTARLCGQLRLDACAICLAGGLGERRYLTWWADATRAGDPTRRSDPGEFCSAHLHDLAGADSESAGEALDRKRTSTIRALEQLLTTLPALTEPGRRRRGTDAVRRDEVQSLLSPLHRCPACRARGTAELRQAELLDAAMALSEVRATYESAHGLCVRHLDRLAAPTAKQLARHVADARLSVLQWELEEVRRKYAWERRHEPAGPEQDAWLRGAIQVDGRVQLGAPYQGSAPSS